MNKPIRWGFLSTAGIAKKNWRALAKSQNGVVAGVASRSNESAQRFIDECQGQCPQPSTPKSYGTYESLLDAQEIDAVYIPLPTGIRKDWIIAAAKKGKHILAEKPTALHADDLKEILAVCSENNVQFMDGVMFMHSGRMKLLHETLSSPEKIGTMRRIETNFSFFGDDDFRKNNIRSNSAYEPHGALGDLGWYCVRFILWAAGWKMPVEVRGRCLSTIQGTESKGPVPSEFSGELIFDGGLSAGFYCSFITEHQQWVHVSGDKGSVRLDDFVLPYFGSEVSFEHNRPTFTVDRCDFHMHRRATRIACPEYASGYSPAQEINMFDTFNSIVTSGKLDPQWGEMSLKTQIVLDQLFKSAGFK